MSCQRLPWHLSAVWAPPGGRHFIQATLRAPGEWMAGLPTFDVRAPWLAAYPAPEPWGERTDRRTPDLLELDRMLELFALVPTTAEVDARHWAAIEPALAWIERHDPRRRSGPTAELGRSLSWAAERARALATAPRVEGTWRVRVELPSGHTARFYLRTAAAIAGAYFAILPPGRRVEGDPRPRRADGFELYVWHAPTPAGLPSGDSAAVAGVWRGGRGLVLEDSAGAAGWRGKLRPEMLPSAVPGDSAVAAAVEAWGEDHSRRWRAGDVSLFPLRFFEDGDTLRFRQLVPTDGRPIRLEGARVGHQTVARRR